MRRIHLSVLVGAVLALPFASSAADGSRTVTAETLKQDAHSTGIAIKKNSKALGAAVKQTSIKIGHAAKDFGEKVAAAAKQGAQDARTKSKD